MPPIICIVGRSKAGKTRLITRLIPELKGRGYRVATVKHTHHKVETDVIGKDTWLHAQAGSECTVLCSPDQLNVTRKVEGDLGPAEAARMVPDGFDVVLAEGFKHTAEPKIEVYRREIGEMVSPPHELLAVVTDEPLGLGIPQYSPDEIAGIASFIEAEVLLQRQKAEVEVSVDGNPIPLNGFVRDILSRGIGGMLDSLKGVENPSRITINITKEQAAPPSPKRSLAAPELETLKI